MARKKKQAGGGENTDGWLTTYADLISLLLCFFVLMYAASTPDEAKMQWILKAMTPIRGEIVNPVVADDVMDESEGGTDENQTPEIIDNSEGDVYGVRGELPLTFDELFNWVSVAIESNNLDASVDAFPGRMHIRFDSDVMFAPGSPELLNPGRIALNTIAPGIAAVNDFIQNVYIEGHTAPAPDGGPFLFTDQGLSQDRALAVHTHLTLGRREIMVDANKYKTVGHGPWQPHYQPITEEETNRKNRRVELVITRNDFNPEDTPLVLDMLTYDYKIPAIPGSPLDGRAPEPGNFPRHAEILKNIKQRHGISDDTANGSSNSGSNEFGPQIPGLPQVPSSPSENGSGAD
jgi:chemotaxis protein MotB